MEIGGILITRELLIGMIRQAVKVSPKDIYYRRYSWEEGNTKATCGIIKSTDFTYMKVEVQDNHISFFMGMSGSVIDIKESSVDFSLHDEEAEELIIMCKNVVLSRRAPDFDQHLKDLNLKQ